MMCNTIYSLCILLSFAGLAGAANDPNDEKEILATMDAMRKATIAKDIATLDKIYHPELTQEHSSGRTQSKAEVLQTVKEGKQTWDAIEYSDVRIWVFGKAAVLKAIANLRSGPPGQTTPKRSDMLFVLVKDFDRWQIVARQSTSLRP